MECQGNASLTGLRGGAGQGGARPVIGHVPKLRSQGTETWVDSLPLGSPREPGSRHHQPTRLSITEVGRETLSVTWHRLLVSNVGGARLRQCPPACSWSLWSLPVPSIPPAPTQSIPLGTQTSIHTLQSRPGERRGRTGLGRAG